MKLLNCHRDIDDQCGVVLSRLVFPNVPVTHSIAEAGQSADDADKSG